MVDVGRKKETARTATAEGILVMSPRTLALLEEGRTPKGDPFLVAQIAGIQAAKRTAELIPLCHTLPLSSVDVRVESDDAIPGVRATATVRVVARTGVESADRRERRAHRLRHAESCRSGCGSSPFVYSTKPADAAANGSLMPRRETTWGHFRGDIMAGKATRDGAGGSVVAMATCCAISTYGCAVNLARRLPYGDEIAFRSVPGRSGLAPAARRKRTMMSSVLVQWEQESIGPLRRRLGGIWAALRGPVLLMLFGTATFGLGVYLASAPWSPLADFFVRQRLAGAEAELKARQGELELARLELARMNNDGLLCQVQDSRRPGCVHHDIALARGSIPSWASTWCGWRVGSSSVR